jgi:hypothetical protein
MACPVCFTGDDPVTRDSLTAGIGVLLGVTFVVLLCFATFFITLARRARRVHALEAAGAATPHASAENAAPPEQLGWESR